MRTHILQEYYSPFDKQQVSQFLVGYVCVAVLDMAIVHFLLRNNTIALNFVIVHRKTHYLLMNFLFLEFSIP